MTKKKKLLTALCVIVALVAIVVLVNMFTGKDKGHYAMPATETVIAREGTYQTYLDSHGYADTLSDAVIDVDVFTWEKSEDSNAQTLTEGVDTGDTGSITWKFNVEQDGFYNLEVGYMALKGTTSDIQRRVLIDGEAPYEALTQIVFKRIWRDEDIRLKNENEIRPNADEVYEVQKVFLEDYDRRSGAPLILHLTAGEHTLTLDAVKEPMEVTSLSFKAAPELESYETVLAKWQSEGKTYAGDAIIGQAERRAAKEGQEATKLSYVNATKDILKSSPAITVQKNYSDAALEPYHAWHILYPTIGASNWAQPGDALTWQIDAPEDGLYVLTFKGRQTSRGVTSYRRLSVNGEVPFAEAEVVGFGYSGTMQNYTLANEQGEPYYVYLHKGTNDVKLECVLGGIGGVLSEVEEALRNLNALYLSTIQITGNVPSQFIDYEIAKKVPTFVSTMQAESERLFKLVDQMVAITGEKGENTAMLEKMAIQAEGLADDPENIVKELSQLKNNISALGTWIVNISTMPLELDAVMLSKDVASLPAPTEGKLEGAIAEVQRFWSTFFHSTSDLVASDDGTKKASSIKVWMASAGREQAQIIQNMIDETFSPNTDIAVNLQLIPMDVVLRAALAGNGPDVVIGLNQATAQDFAMRGAIVDLSQYADYKEYVSRYSEGVLHATQYGDSAYGIPEQVSFQMLFYREDVLEELGLTVPTTWDEVMEMIPVLNRENYEFYMPSTRVATGLNVFQAMIYQNDGEIYEGEGADYGIASALHTDEAMEAFKWFTDLFTVHGLEVQADFSNRFRTGEMPIGVTDYTTYCTLEIFAPEIKGLWSFSAFPGSVKEDGSIDNTYVADTVQTVIMNGADDKDAAWAFVKWWNDTAQQTSYATTLEAIMGAAARYPAADPNVIRNLPWSNAESTQLLAQYDSLTSMPAVPGYYMNTRMISYAFEDVVADLANPRETLYLNIRDINKELTKKREEFGLNTAE
ncbi:MAG: extracellular solute-binding protein [Clostridia bacterium]|nr:extracellular solute-binding protein [Clostridia bacterium]